MNKYATNIVPVSLGSSDTSSNAAQAHVFGASKPKLKSRPLDNRNRFLVQKTSDGKGGYTIQPYQLTPQERERVSDGVDEVKKYTSHPGYRPQSGTVLSDRGAVGYYRSPAERKAAYGTGRPVQVASKESRKLAKDSPLAKDILDQSAAQVDAIALQGKEREALMAARLLELSRGYHRRKAFRDAANNLVGGKLRMSPGEVFPNVHSSALPITLGGMAATDTPEKFRFKDLDYEEPNKYHTERELDTVEKYDPQNFWRTNLDAHATPSGEPMDRYLRHGKPSFMGDQVAAGKVPIVAGDDFSYMPFPSVRIRDWKTTVNPDGQINVPRARKALPADIAKQRVLWRTSDYRDDYVDANGNIIPRGQRPTDYGPYNDSYDEYEGTMHEAVHSRTIPLSRIYMDDAKKLDAVFGTGPFDRKSGHYYEEGYADTDRYEFTRAMGVFKDALLRDMINSGMSPEEAVRKVQDPQFAKSRMRGIYNNVQDPQLPLTKYETHSYHYPGTMARDNNAVEVDRAVLGLQPFAQRLLYPGPAGNLVYDMTKDTTKNMPNQRLYSRLMDMGRRNLPENSRDLVLASRAAGKEPKIDPKEVIYNPTDTDLLFYNNAGLDNTKFNDKNKYEDFNREISPEELQQAFDIIWPQVRNKELNDRNNNLV